MKQYTIILVIICLMTAGILGFAFAKGSLPVGSSEVASEFMAAEESVSENAVTEGIAAEESVSERVAPEGAAAEE